MEFSSSYSNAKLTEYDSSAKVVVIFLSSGIRNSREFEEFLTLGGDISCVVGLSKFWNLSPHSFCSLGLSKIKFGLLCFVFA